MRVIEKTNTKIVREFTSISDMMEFSRPNELPDHVDSKSGSQRFTGTKSLEEAVKLAEEGWTDGTTAMLEKLAQVKSHTTESVKGYRWDVTGDIFDVGAVLSGEPECWLHPEPTPDRRVFKICVNMTASADISKEKIMIRGAAVMGLVDKLQEIPENIIELTLFHGVSDCPPYNQSIYFLQLGTTPLPMNEVSFATAHPSMLRRINCTVSERDNNGQSCGGYGHVMELPSKEQEQFDLYLKGTCAVNHGDLGSFDHIDGAAKWVDNQIEKFNGKHHE